MIADSLGRSTAYGLAAAAAVVLLAGCQTTIEEGLTDQQANQVIGALYDHAIAATKEPDKSGGRRDRYRVRVSSRDAARSLAHLRSVGLPRPPTTGWKEVIDSANRWLQVMGHPATIRSYLIADEKVSDQPVSRSDVGQESLVMSRRDLFKTLAHKTRQVTTGKKIGVKIQKH